MSKLKRWRSYALSSYAMMVITGCGAANSTGTVIQQGTGKTSITEAITPSSQINVQHGVTIDGQQTTSTATMQNATDLDVHTQCHKDQKTQKVNCTTKVVRDRQIQDDR